MRFAFVPPPRYKYRHENNTVNSRLIGGNTRIRCGIFDPFGAYQPPVMVVGKAFDAINLDVENHPGRRGQITVRPTERSLGHSEFTNNVVLNAVLLRSCVQKRGVNQYVVRFFFFRHSVLYS